MARGVFFSFHYGLDIFRVNQIRNCNLTRDRAGFIDKADFEKIQRRGDAAVQRWIDQQMEGTSTTIVLIGSETSKRPYVQYEIEKSWERGNALIGIYIHNLNAPVIGTSYRGENPFDLYEYEEAGFGGLLTAGRKKLSSKVNTYDWKTDGGYHNIENWIEWALNQHGWGNGKLYKRGRTLLTMGTSFRV